MTTEFAHRVTTQESTKGAQEHAGETVDPSIARVRQQAEDDLTLHRMAEQERNRARAETSSSSEPQGTSHTQPMDLAHSSPSAIEAAAPGTAMPEFLKRADVGEQPIELRVATAPIARSGAKPTEVFGALPGANERGNDVTFRRGSGSTVYLGSMGRRR